jgi:hypothetical protein
MASGTARKVNQGVDSFILLDGFLGQKKATD